MFKNKFVVIWFAGIASVAMPAYSQSEDTGRQEVSVQGMFSIVKNSTDKGIENKATESGGVLATYRYIFKGNSFFDSHSAAEFNYGYTLNTQSYGSVLGTTREKSYSHEVSAAYVFRMPRRDFTPFLLAGAAGLIFDPKDSPGSAQARPAFMYGGGADFNLKHNVFMRVEYRGFLYNSPTFDLKGLSGDARVTHRAEPSIGFGYRF
jgi:opacity protein-like surface antigen